MRGKSKLKDVHEKGELKVIIGAENLSASKDLLKICWNKEVN